MNGKINGKNHADLLSLICIITADNKLKNITQGIIYHKSVSKQLPSMHSTFKFHDVDNVTMRCVCKALLPFKRNMYYISVSVCAYV